MTGDMTMTVGVLVTRILIVLAGVLLCFLGYRLFRQIPSSDGTTEIRLSDHLKFNLSKVGPGAFFALFGTVILIYMLSNPATYTWEKGSIYGNNIKDDPVPLTETITIAGMHDTTVIIVGELTLEQMQAHMRFLNNLNGLIRSDLTMEEIVRFEVDQREIKLAIMARGWDNQWVDFANFTSWARGESNQKPSSDIVKIWEIK